jgi:hypothetical protein
MSNKEMLFAGLVSWLPPPTPNCARVRPALDSFDSNDRITAGFVLQLNAIRSDDIGVPSFTAMHTKVCVATAKRELEGMRDSEVCNYHYYLLSLH